MHHGARKRVASDDLDHQRIDPHHFEYGLRAVNLVPKMRKPLDVSVEGLFKRQSGRRDLNPRPPEPHSALAKLRYAPISVMEETCVATIAGRLDIVESAKVLSMRVARRGRRMHFADRLNAAVKRVGNPVMVGIDPRAEDLPNGFLERFPETRAGVGEALRVFGCGVVDAVENRCADRQISIGVLRVVRAGRNRGGSMRQPNTPTNGASSSSWTASATTSAQRPKRMRGRILGAVRWVIGSSRSGPSTR